MFLFCCFRVLSCENINLLSKIPSKSCSRFLWLRYRWYYITIYVISYDYNALMHIAYLLLFHHESCYLSNNCATTIPSDSLFALHLYNGEMHFWNECFDNNYYKLAVLVQCRWSSLLAIIAYEIFHGQPSSRFSEPVMVREPDAGSLCFLHVVHLFIMHRLASVADGIPAACDRLDAFSLIYPARDLRIIEWYQKNILTVSIFHITVVSQRTYIWILFYSCFSSDGWDNPFRPDGDLSKEADQIVELIKEGKPITPTPTSATSPLLPDHSSDVKHDQQPVTSTPTKANGTCNEKNAVPPNVEVQRGNYIRHV